MDTSKNNGDHIDWLVSFANTPLKTLMTDTERKTLLSELEIHLLDREEISFIMDKIIKSDVRRILKTGMNISGKGGSFARNLTRQKDKYLKAVDQIEKGTPLEKIIPTLWVGGNTEEDIPPKLADELLRLLKIVKEKQTRAAEIGDKDNEALMAQTIEYLSESLNGWTLYEVEQILTSAKDEFISTHLFHAIQAEVSYYFTLLLADPPDIFQERVREISVSESYIFQDGKIKVIRVPTAPVLKDYIKHKLAQLLDGCAWGTVNICPFCNKFFYNPTKRKKIFCNHNCGAAYNAAETRRKDPEGCREKQRALMKRRYELKKAAKTAPAEK